VTLNDEVKAIAWRVISPDGIIEHDTEHCGAPEARRLLVGSRTRGIA